jgi:hypothetical protein
MIPASEASPGITAFFVTDDRASMPASIVQNVHGTIMVAGNNNRLKSEAGCNIIAWFWYLTFVSNINPCVSENTTHFQIKNVLAHVYFSVHAIIGYEPRNIILRIKSRQNSFAHDWSPHKNQIISFA